jgi:Tfp pilus assembly protein PilV
MNLHCHKMGRRALSLLEVIVASFLLSFTALGVLSLTQSAFNSQRRTQHLQDASLIASTHLARIRQWASSATNYYGSWALYNGVSQGWKGGVYTVRTRCTPAGRACDSPCNGLEADWRSSSHGSRSMPSAVVPVEVTVSWSTDPRDTFVVVSYVGEPDRNPADISMTVTGPTPVSLPMAATCSYAIQAADSASVPFPNIIYSWAVDERYVSETSTSPRHGRNYSVVRDKTTSPPTPAIGPNGLMVRCFGSYAGRALTIQPKPLDLP